MTKRNEHITIAIAGRMNAGKSSLLNILSGQRDFAIVDEHPGTTADTVATRMEIHELGPVRILDTAGIDEYSPLGEKKRKKTYSAIEEADITLIVVDLLGMSKTDSFSIEHDIIHHAKRFGKHVMIVYNIFQNRTDPSDFKLTDDPILTLPCIHINALDMNEQKPLVDFIATNLKQEHQEVDLIPITDTSGYVLLVIPMDEETPSKRLLRPQDMAVENLLRKYLIPVLYRMDLKKARSSDNSEKNRFSNLVTNLNHSNEKLKLIITDSQAMDILGNWTPPDIPLTTFSIMMTHYMSNGNLQSFTNALNTFASLKHNDKILIMESCNHDRKCDDIGTKQIPRLIKEKLGLNLQIDFSFGRPIPENIADYKLVIHCGGCMIDKQNYQRRLKILNDTGIPITNYGLFLSWVHHPSALNRVTKLFLLL